MKKSQLNAIAYAYAEKKRRENRDEIVSLGLWPIFRAQKSYKTMSWFLKARENCWKKYEKMINELRDKMDFEGNYEQWMANNSFDRDEKKAHNARAARCALVAAMCARELDRILNRAIVLRYGGPADGNR